MIAQTPHRLDTPFFFSLLDSLTIEICPCAAVTPAAEQTGHAALPLSPVDSVSNQPSNRHTARQRAAQQMS